MDTGMVSRIGRSLFFSVLVSVLALGGSARANSYYWDANGASAGTGGSGTWTTASTWRDGSPTGTLVTWANGHEAVFQGTPGDVIIAATPVSATSILVQVTGYIIEPDATTSTRVMTGPVTLSSNVGLTLNTNGVTTANRVLSVGSISGASGSLITLRGDQTPGARSSRINLATASQNISVPTTLSGSGGGLVGYVATATGTQISGNITNNTAQILVLGATSGNALTLNAVVAGSGGVQFSAGESGGGGTVTFNQAATYNGATLFNAATGCRVAIGVDNGLSTNSTITFSSAGGNGGFFDLSGFNQTMASLTQGGGTVGYITNSSASVNSVLTINGSLSGTYGLTMGDGNAGTKLSLVRNGTGSTTLTNNCVYRGDTTILGGTLALGVIGAFTNSPIITVTNGATFSVAARNSTLALNSWQTFRVAGITTGTVAVAASKSLTLSSGGIEFKRFNGVNAPLQITGADSLALSSAPVTVTVENGGVPLPASVNYKLVAIGAGNTTAVSGSAGTVTVNGDGIVGTASLVISGGELYLLGTAAANDSDSRVEAPGTQVSGGSVSSLATNAGSAVDVFSMKITDLGTADGLATKVTQVTIVPATGNTADWTDTLQGVKLFNVTDAAAVTIGAPTISDTSIVIPITSGNLDIPDAGNKDIRLSVYLNTNNISDSAILKFKVSSTTHGFTADAAGSTFNASFPGDVTGNNQTLQVVATKLGFTSVPSSALINVNFSASVAAQDVNGNTDTDDTTSVTITKASGSGTLTGGGAQSLVAGVKTFSTLQIDTVGTITLQAAGGILSNGTSGSISVTRPMASGDIAIIGMNDSGSPADSYAFVALADIPAATKIYFTDNGWSNNMGYRGASATDGNGNETFTLLTTVNPIPAGTIIVSSNTTSPDFTWTTSGNIAPGGIGTYGALALGNGGEQIYAFTSVSNDNPMFYTNAITHLYVLDDTAGFEDSFDSATGNLAPGLTNGLTAVTLPSTTTWTVSLDGATRTMAQWLAYIGNTNNWLAGLSTASMPTGTISVASLAPEPAVHASAVAFSGVTTTNMDVSWVAGDGTNHLVVMRQGSAVTWRPEDGSNYTGNANFSAATDQGSGNKIIFAGTGTNVNVTGLSYSTTYHVAVYEYNGAANLWNYYTNAGFATGNQTTLAPPNSTESDIIRDTGFSEPVNVAYASYQTNDISGAGDSLEVARFTIRDGGADITDSDGNATTLTALSMGISNSSVLRRVALFDGSTELAETNATSSVTFSGLSLAAQDEGTSNLSVRVTFQSSVTDNVQFSFTNTSATALGGGSDFTAANAGGAVSDTSGDANRIEVTATKLAFSGLPAVAIVSNDFSVSVAARDALNSLDLDDTTSVTISKLSGPGTVSGGGAQALVAGVKTFSGLQATAAGQIVLQAVGGSLTDGNSGTLNVNDLLAVGDIAWVGFNADGTDDVSFVTFADILPNTILFFSDNEWNGTNLLAGGGFNDFNEGVMAWHSGGSTIPAGAVIGIYGTSTTNMRVATTGSVLYGLSSLGNSAEGIFCYQSSDGTNVVRILGAIGNDTVVNSFSSLTGSGLTDSDTANRLTATADIGKYKGTRTGHTKSGFRTLQMNSMSNWDLQDAGGDQSYDATLPDLPFDLTSFVILADPPNVDAASIAFSGVASNAMTVGWVNGNGAGRIVVARASSAVTFSPTDGTTYAANADFSAAVDQGSGNKVVYDGSGTNVSVTGLNPATTYHFAVYEYNGAGVTINYYQTGTPLTGSQTTLGLYTSESDIIRATGFTEPWNVDYASYQAANITFGTSLEVAQFTIRDGGSDLTDVDSVGTTLDSFTIAITNSANLRRVALYNGSTEIAEQAAGATVTFSGISGLVAADGGSTNFSVRVTYMSSVTDNQQYVFTVTGTGADPTGSAFAAGDAGGAASSNTGDANRIEVTATTLAFSSVPSTVTVGANFSATVQARDANSNVDLDDTTSVTVTKFSGTGSLTGGSAQSLVAGSRTFSTLQIDASGSFTLQAAGGSLSNGTSASITATGKPVVISGYHANPAGNDGPFEYVQLVAVENVDFSVTPLSVVWNNNSTATTNGWVQGAAISYKFNITSGTMTTGDVAYVGGSGKTINGTGSTDISGQTWLRAINTSTTAGDGFGTSGGTGGNLGNGGGNADGIAIFNGTSLTDTTIPIDTVMFGTGLGTAVVASGTDGYVMATNDHYTATYLPTNGFFFADPASGAYQKLTGVYQTSTKTWLVARTLTAVNGPTTVGQIATGITVLQALNAPVASAATGIGPFGFTASWSSVSGATGYRLDVSTSPSFLSFVSGYSNLSVAGTSQLVSGLTPDTTYYFRVRAVDAYQTSSDSNVQSAYLPIPTTVFSFK